MLWWFGIYFVAQLPIIPWTLAWWQMWLLFPMTMEWGFMGLMGSLIPKSVWQADGNQHAATILYNCAWTVAAILPWATYVTHCICTLCVRQRRSFLILMWILGGILILNLASCAYFIHAPPA